MFVLFEMIFLYEIIAVFLGCAFGAEFLRARKEVAPEAAKSAICVFVVYLLALFSAMILDQTVFRIM